MTIMLKLKQTKNGRFRIFGTASTVLVISLCIILNIALYTASSALGWTIYATERYEHTVSQASIEGVRESAGPLTEIKILFCMPQEELERDTVYSLVLNTARQYAAQLDFVSVGTLEIFTDPASVDRYKYKTDPDTGERIQINKISSTSVIVDSTDRFFVQPLSAFFVLDSEQTIEAYYGEEIMGALLRRVMTETVHTAYYTTRHGEAANTSLYNLLVCAGYDIKTINLMEETPQDSEGLIVISNPSYDFARGADGVISEIEKLGAFMDSGGMVMILLDPLAQGLTNLYAFCSERGISIDGAIIRDPSDAITSDGYTLVLGYADSSDAAVIENTVSKYTSARVIAREASSLTLSDVTGYKVSPLLISSGSSRSYRGSKLVSSDGNFVVSAVSSKTGGGTLMLTSSYYLAAHDSIESDGYSNKEYIYAALSVYRKSNVPFGASMLTIEQTLLEDLTFSAVRLWSVLLIIILPASVALCGIIILRRRRRA